MGRGPAPGTFDFLGFTHLSGMNRSGGYGLRRKTIPKRWHAKLREVKTELRSRMHDPVPMQARYLRSVVDGHFRYYGVPGNTPPSNPSSMAEHALRRRYPGKTRMR